MDPPFFQEIGASDKLWTNLSLSVQLGWFEQLKPSLCNSPKSLFTFASFLCQILHFGFSNNISFFLLTKKEVTDNKTARLIANFCS